MEDSNQLFNQKVQAWKNNSTLTTARLTIDSNGTLKLIGNNSAILLEGPVKKYRYEDRGFGPSVGFRILPRGFHVSYTFYELLFYDKIATSYSDDEVIEHQSKKRLLKKTLADLGAYSGGAKNFFNKLIFVVLGIIAVAVALAYYLKTTRQ